MLHKKMTCQEAMMRDKLLFDMSTYLVCNGMIMRPQTDEEFEEYHNRIVTCFNNLKRQIQNGEFTFEQIVDDIIARCGPVDKSGMLYNDLDSDERINKVIKSFEQEYEMQEQSENCKKMLDEFIRNTKSGQLNDPFAIMVGNHIEGSDTQGEEVEEGEQGDKDEEIILFSDNPVNQALEEVDEDDEDDEDEEDE